MEPPQELGKASQTKSLKWWLTFHLQALDDPSLLTDVGTVWKESSKVLTFLTHRFGLPEKRLMADLRWACRLFPPLEQSLKVACPVACELSTQDAYAFLKEAPPLLEQSGFGVLIPPWWQKPSARLGLRLKVKPKGQSNKTEGARLFGLEALAEFDWEMALDKKKLSREELEILASLKVLLTSEWTH